MSTTESKTGTLSPEIKDLLNLLISSGQLVSDGTLWEGQTALYFRWTCLPDGAVPELAAGFSRNDRRLS